jgi:hypothetical protein
MLQNISNVLSNVPSDARTAILRFQSSGIPARAKLYIFEDDQAPRILHGPHGLVSINIATGRQIFLETLDRSGWDFKCVGYRYSWGTQLTERLTHAWNISACRSGMGLPILGFLVGGTIPALYWKFAGGPKGEFLAFVYNVAPMLAVIVSVVTLIVSLRHNRFSMGVDILSRLNKEFDSTDMKGARTRAARALQDIETREDSDVNKILDFFENLALLERRGAIDIELIWHSFYYWLTCYFDTTSRYRADARREDPTQWEDIERLARRIQAEQQKHAIKISRNPLREMVNSSDAQLSFLNEEMHLVPPNRRRKVRRRSC